MSTLLAIFLSMLAHNYKAPEPFLKFIGSFMPGDCGIDDPLGPCTNEHLVAYNPQLEAVEMTISCGPEYDDKTVSVCPRSSTDIYIQLPVPASNHSLCHRKSWKPAKRVDGCAKRDE